MWQADLKVIAKKASQAVHAIDRFHIMQQPGIVEGFNNKAKLITRQSYGSRTKKAYEIARYHNLGALPEPDSNHEFL